MQNTFEEYKDIFKERNVNYINHYTFESFKALKLKDVPDLQMETYMWGSSDRFYKLASTYYGNEKYWWIIAWYNQTPTEHHVEMGQILKIPTPLYKVLSILRLK